jgi:CheY-like chemotaxis protein
MTSAATPKHILALNDSPEVLELFAELLAEEGYRVTTQPYASRDFPAIVDMAPDLIILDYIWATDDAGWSLLQMLKMKPSTQAIPVVLCTGAVAQVESLKSHLHEMGVQVVLKPFNIDDLLQAVTTALGDAGPSS